MNLDWKVLNHRDLDRQTKERREDAIRKESAETECL